MHLSKFICLLLCFDIGLLALFTVLPRNFYASVLAWTPDFTE